MSKKFSDYTPMEQLAIKQALFKTLADDVGTKDPDNLRGEVDAQVIGFYEQTGAKSYDVRVDGTKVGTMSVTVSKPVPERTESRMAVVEDDELDAWIKDVRNVEHVIAFVLDNNTDIAWWWLKRTGELLPGCEMVEYVIPVRDSEVKGTSIRINPPDVAKALGTNLPTAIAGLLGDDTE